MWLSDLCGRRVLPFFVNGGAVTTEATPSFEMVFLSGDVGVKVSTDAAMFFGGAAEDADPNCLDEGLPEWPFRVTSTDDSSPFDKFLEVAREGTISVVFGECCWCGLLSRLTDVSIFSCFPP